MVLVNYTTRELTAKIVYYGPGLCGKTTNLQYIFDSLPPDKKGKMISLATKTDRTLFFDFLPLDLGTIKGMRTRIQLYTVPGQVFYNETRKLVLRGADGIVFVADSNRNMMDANQESLQNLRDNLREYDVNLDEIPLVLQYNKRDLPNIYSVEELDQSLKQSPNWPGFEAVAIDGTGVHETLKAISKLVLRHLAAKFSAGAAAEKPAVAAPAAASTPASAAPAAATPPPAPVAETPAPTPPPVEVPKPAAPEPSIELDPSIELEPPAAEAPEPGSASIGGDMSDEEYAKFYGGGSAIPDEEEEPVAVETDSGVASIGGEMSDEEYANFYGGGTAVPDDVAGDDWSEPADDGLEDEAITIDAGSADDMSDLLQPEQIDLDTPSDAGAGMEVEDLSEWTGGDDTDLGLEEEPVSLELESDQDVFVLDASTEEPAPEEPVAPEPEQAPVIPARPSAGGPEIRPEEAIEVPIPLELVGGHAEITRTVVVPLKFSSPTGEQIFELKLQLHLKPTSG